MFIRRFVSVSGSICARNTLSSSNRVASFSSFTFMDSGGSIGDEYELWPKSHPNTIFNVCPQGEAMIIERFGKLSSIEKPGLFLAVPLVDNIRFRIDVSVICYY
jgi:hypothetical protein